MTIIDFQKKCIPLNKKYQELFGYIPSLFDYSCTQDEYFAALQTAVSKKLPLDTLLTKVTSPSCEALT